MADDEDENPFARGWKDSEADFRSPDGGGGPGRFATCGTLAGWLASAGACAAGGFHPMAPVSRSCHAPASLPAWITAAASPAAAPAALGPLDVAEGQVTFDAEGNDIPNNPYYSRKIIWPGNAESGVTIGRGYDMGNRTAAKVKSDLMAAGLAEPAAGKFAEGAGKKGVNAKTFVDANREALGEISREVQKSLFENTYPAYVTRARDNYDRWTKGADGKPLAGKVAWDKLDQPIRDILVDFVYQGFTKGEKPMTSGMKNDYDELIKYIKGSTVMQKYEAGRKRAAYLEKARKAKAKPTPKPLT